MLEVCGCGCAMMARAVLCLWWRRVWRMRMHAQIPTQDFFTNDIGLPVTMKPNFEDLSCEMVFGAVRPCCVRAHE